jgi:hypothetical protein
MTSGRRAKSATRISGITKNSSPHICDLARNQPNKNRRVFHKNQSLSTALTGLSTDWSISSCPKTKRAGTYYVPALSALSPYLGVCKCWRLYTYRRFFIYRCFDFQHVASGVCVGIHQCGDFLVPVQDSGMIAIS